jgi:hypothetical protein
LNFRDKLTRRKRKKSALTAKPIRPVKTTIRNLYWPSAPRLGVIGPVRCRARPQTTTQMNIPRHQVAWNLM